MKDKKLNKEIDEAIKELQYKDLLTELENPKPLKILVWLGFVAILFGLILTLILFYIWG